MPPSLENVVDVTKITHKFLPKQSEVERLIKQINRKVLRDTKGYLAYFGPPSHIVCDQDPAFTSSLMDAFATQLNIKLIMTSPTNHKSLQAEHGIKSLSGLLVKHLSEAWSWHSLLPYTMMSYNAYSTPNLDSLSPYELVFGTK